MRFPTWLNRLLCSHPVAPITREGGRAFRRCSYCGKETRGIELMAPRTSAEGRAKQRGFRVRVSG